MSGALQQTSFLCAGSYYVDTGAISRHAGSQLTRGAREQGLNKASGSVMGLKLTNLQAGPSPVQDSGIQHHRWQPSCAQGGCLYPSGKLPGTCYSGPEGCSSSDCTGPAQHYRGSDGFACRWLALQNMMSYLTSTCG